MKVALIVFNLINCSTVSYDDQSALINRQCPTHCIPEVTDKKARDRQIINAFIVKKSFSPSPLKCKRLGRLDNSIYVADCLIVVWDHPSYNGNLKVSTSMSSPSKCILTYRNRRFPNRLSNKAERFKNECLETTWGQWGEWTQINRKSRPSGQMTQSRRRRCDRSQVRSLPSRFRRLLPRYMIKCEKARKIEFRTVKVSKEKTHYSQWSQWSEWSSCSVTCGTGLSIKTRKCLSQKCIGMDQVSRDCKLETCPRVKVPSIIPTSNPCGNITKRYETIKFPNTNWYPYYLVGGNKYHRTESSTIFMELLRVNEDLNSVFNRFERFKKSRPKPLDHDDAPLPADPCPTGLLVDVGASGGAEPMPASPGQVNEEFWLNMNQDNQTAPMGQTEFDKFLAKEK